MLISEVFLSRVRLVGSEGMLLLVKLIISICLFQVMLWKVFLNSLLFIGLQIILMFWLLVKVLSCLCRLFLLQLISLLVLVVLVMVSLLGVLVVVIICVFMVLLIFMVVSLILLEVLSISRVLLGCRLVCCFRVCIEVLQVMLKVVVLVKFMFLGIGIMLQLGILICLVKLFQLVRVMIWLLGLMWVIFLLIVVIILVVLLFGEKGKGGLNWYLFSMIRVFGKLILVVCISRRILFFVGFGLVIFFRIRLLVGLKVLQRMVFIGDVLVCGLVSVGGRCWGLISIVVIDGCL